MQSRVYGCGAVQGTQYQWAYHSPTATVSPYERLPFKVVVIRDDHGDATSVDVYIVEAYVKCHEVSFIIGYNVSVIILTIATY